MLSGEVSPDVDKKAACSAQGFVAAHVLLHLRVLEYRKVPVKEAQLVDYVFRLRLLQIAYELSSCSRGRTLLEYRTMFPVCILRIGRDPGQRLSAQVARGRKQPRPVIKLWPVAPHKEIVRGGLARSFVRSTLANAFRSQTVLGAFR